MCSIESFDILHTTWNVSESCGVCRPLSYGSTADVSVSFEITMNFVDSWIQSLKKNHIHWTTIYSDKMSEFYKNTPVTIPEPKTYDCKNTR